nr:MAG TPA: hypothetical protein [Caudoviricetes sp.]
MDPVVSDGPVPDPEPERRDVVLRVPGPAGRVQRVSSHHARPVCPGDPGAPDLEPVWP